VCILTIRRLELLQPLHFLHFEKKFAGPLGFGEERQKPKLLLLDEKESGSYLKKKQKFLEYLNLDTSGTFGNNFNISTSQ